MADDEDVEQQLREHPREAKRLVRNVGLLLGIIMMAMVLLGIVTLINRG